MKITAIVMVLLIIAIIPSLSHAQLYTLRMYTNKENYLNTDTVQAYYVAYGKDGKTLPDGKGTWYLNTSLNNTPVVSGNITGSHGEFKIPLYNLNLTNVGAGEDFNLVLIFNYAGEQHKVSQGIWIADSHFLIFQVHAYPETPGFHPGSMVTVAINSPVPDERVRYIAIFHNTAVWQNLTSVKLDYNGYATYNFQIPKTWKDGDFVNIVAVIGNSTASTSFTVGIWHNLHMNITPRNGKVISGDTITINIHYQNISSPYFHFYILAGTTVLYRYFTSSSAITYKVPDNFSGFLEVKCEIFNSTKEIGTVDNILQIKYAELGIQFSQLYYSGNENIDVYAEFRSHVIKEPTFIYSIYAYTENSYVLINKITTTMARISFHIPSDPPEAYTISVLAYDSEHSVSAQSSIHYLVPVQLQAHVITKSSYSTSAYTPGEILEIKYSVSGIRSSGFLYYGFGSEFYTHPKIIRITGNTTGVLKITIPYSTNKGIYIIHIQIVTSEVNRELDVPIFVDDNPPWSQYLIFTIPAADFLTLLLVGAGFIALALYLKPEKNKPTPKKEKEKTSESGKESL
ncbi:MAG: hypothetical protein GXO25_07820 [Euryarchaeota archaeon]|nr:hypothetical protein [Euryarchaeota archaeon]